MPPILLTTGLLGAGCEFVRRHESQEEALERTLVGLREGSGALGEPAEASAGCPALTPYDVPPSVTNASDMREAFTNEYPASLRDAGVGGTVVVCFYIGWGGALGDLAILESSGFSELDQAALRVARAFRFDPARRRDGSPIDVWVAIPFTFQPNSETSPG